jgi:iron complex transport system substrate-binding protein
MKRVFHVAVALAALFFTLPALAQSFPVTIKHAHGETVIPAAPQRVVTWGWSSTEAAIALGTVPVGFPTFRSEGLDLDVVPWVQEAIDAAGVPTPVYLDNAASPPIEQIAALKPDLILAVYSGITEDEYKLLSRIAPVVAYPTTPWTASWQETITIVGEALGKADEGRAMVADLEQFIKDEAAKHPVLAGTSAVTMIDYNGAAAIHSADDARAKLLKLAGLAIPDRPAAAGEPQGFWYALSYENFDQIPADVLITFFSTEQAADEWFARDYVQIAPQIARGAYVRMDNRLLNSAVISSSALSIRWGMPQYFELIAEAAEKAKE